MVLVEYPNGLLFSLAVNGAAADPREISILDGTGGRIGIEPQEIHGCGLTILQRIPKSMGSEVSTALTVLSLPHFKTVSWCSFFLVALRASFQARADAAPEILALCQPVAVLKRSRLRPHPSTSATGCSGPLSALWPLSSRMDEISFSSLFFKSSLSAAHWVFEDRRPGDGAD